MTRLNHDNLNTSEWFDQIWSLNGIHKYNATRLREFLRPMDENKTLLDVGAGWWGTAQYAMHHGFQGRYIAFDFSEEARRRTLEIVPKLDYRIGDARALPFADGSIDVVACGELIEHMEDPAAFVNELARVCKPGGYVIISTLNALCDAAIAHGDYPEHLWRWETKEELLPYFTPHGRARVWEHGHYFMAEVRKKVK